VVWSERCYWFPGTTGRCSSASGDAGFDERRPPGVARLAEAAWRSSGAWTAAFVDARAVASASADLLRHRAIRVSELMYATLYRNGVPAGAVTAVLWRTRCSTVESILLGRQSATVWRL